MVPDLPDADALLIVPPMAHLTWPSLGVETLAALGRREGWSVAVLYGNAVFARRIGTLAYANLANAPGDWLIGERLFARAAFGRDGLGAPGFAARVQAHDAEATAQAREYLDHLSDAAGMVPEAWGAQYPMEALRDHEQAAMAFIEEMVAAIGERYPIVGVTSSFDQTAAAYALLARLKARHPGLTTAIGGANCEAEMAEAIGALGPGIDHVFAGESEASFLDLLAGRCTGRVVRGTPCVDLDALPTPSYDAYFEQLRTCVPELLESPLWLSYESSRGCWWGQKHHCTFCGLNGMGMGFRQRAPDRVLEDLGAMLARYPTRRVAMTDNIMPHGYHRTLIPRLREAVPDVHVFYEQKANLSLAQVAGLYEAGVRVIQPGIESLATPVLERMRKGVTARQNLDLLRYARAVGMVVKWNLLYAFPGDDAEDYRAMATLLPRLHHLSPPNALTHLSIDRFSPYFDRPEEHGITALHPLPAYAEVFPEHVDPAAIAYHFQGEWPSGSREAKALLGTLWSEVVRWRRAWEGGAPAELRVLRVGAGWALIDTRGTTPGYLPLTEAQAVAVTAGGPLGVGAGPWAERRGYAVALDGRTVGLATGTVEALAWLKSRTVDAAPVQVLTRRRA